MKLKLIFRDAGKIKTFIAVLLATLLFACSCDTMEMDESSVDVNESEEFSSVDFSEYPSLDESSEDVSADASDDISEEASNDVSAVKTWERPVPGQYNNKYECKNDNGEVYLTVYNMKNGQTWLFNDHERVRFNGKDDDDGYTFLHAFCGVIVGSKKYDEGRMMRFMFFRPEDGTRYDGIPFIACYDFGIKTAAGIPIWFTEDDIMKFGLVRIDGYDAELVEYPVETKFLMEDKYKKDLAELYNVFIEALLENDKETLNAITSFEVTDEMIKSWHSGFEHYIPSCNLEPIPNDKVYEPREFWNGKRTVTPEGICCLYIDDSSGGISQATFCGCLDDYIKRFDTVITYVCDGNDSFKIASVEGGEYYEISSTYYVYDYEKMCDGLRNNK